MSWLGEWWRGELYNAAPANTAPVTVTPVKPFHELALEQLDLLTKFVKQSSNIISPSVYSQLRSIDDVMRPLLKYLENHSIVAEQEYTIQTMLTDYIPTPLNTFLMLQEKDQVEGGKADLLLLQQYDTLERSVRKLADQIYARTLSALDTHAIFIENKFGN